MRVATAFLALGLLAAAAPATTITVSPGGPIPTLQDGINAAVDGDTILVLAGTYVGDFTNTKSRLIIRGVGVVTLTGNGSFVGAKRCIFQNFTINGTTTALLLDLDSHGNLLSNLAVTSMGGPTPIGIQIDGNRNVLSNSTVSATEIAVEVNGSFNAVFKCAGGPTTNDDVFSIGGNRNLVSGCFATNSGDDGFDIGGRGCVVIKCLATTSGAAGFRLGGRGTTVSVCAADSNAESGMTIDNDGNLVSKCRFGVGGGNAGPGIAFDGADGNLVTGCAVVGNLGGGIYFGTPLGDGNDNRIERNKILGNTGHGILLSTSMGTSDDNWIERNLVSGNTGDGIRVESDHNVVTGNRASANGGTQISNTGMGNLLSNNNPAP